LPESPLIGAGTNGTTIGANLILPALPVSVMISDIAYVTNRALIFLNLSAFITPATLLSASIVVLLPRGLAMFFLRKRR
jgi:hypothetical protein